MKRCRTCEVEKPLDQFYRDKASRVGKWRPHCKACTSAASSARYHANPELRARKSAREKERQAETPRIRTAEDKFKWKLWTHYRLRPERYYEMLAAQGGRCAVCRTDVPGGPGGWHIDHDHACCAGKKSCGRCVRALLCTRCNVGLGMFRDNPELLRSAASYLDAAMQSLGAIA